MAIRCPEGVRLYRPHNPGAVVNITLADLGIFDTDPDLNVFFVPPPGGGSAAFVDHVDDANGTTVWSLTNVVPPDRGGQATNTGTTIIYTQSPNAQVDDCVWIEYYASNQGDNPQDDDCVNQFVLCLGDDPNNNAGPLVCQGATQTVDALSNQIQSFNVQNLATGGTPPYRLSANTFAVTDANGDPAQVNVYLNQAGTTISVAQNTPAGIYTISYNVIDSGTPTQQTTVTCSMVLNVQGDTPNPVNPLVCRQQTQNVDFNALPESYAVQNLATGGLPPYRLSTNTFSAVNAGTQQVEPNISLSADGSTITVGAGVATGVYTLTYNAIDSGNPQQTTVQCTTTLNVQANGVVGGDEDIDCTASFWVNGTPQLDCPAPAATYVIQLINNQGQPVTTPANLINFNHNLPAGAVVQVVATDGNGRYDVNIDMSNAICAGSRQYFVAF